MTSDSGPLNAHGFELLSGLLGVFHRQQLIDELGTLPAGCAGQRELLDQLWCQTLVGRLRKVPCLSMHLTPDLVAVQCTLFEKSPDRNWLVTLHQDLTIPVARRVPVPTLTGWSVKGGRHFVLAPPEVLSGMLAVRLHLDDATEADGGLRFVPGSHRDGVLDDEGIRRRRADAGELAVDARAGDVLLLRPLVLHASSKARSSRGLRRVLHLLFGPPELPHGLQWRTAV